MESQGIFQIHPGNIAACACGRNRRRTCGRGTPSSSGSARKPISGWKRPKRPRNTRTRRLRTMKPFSQASRRTTPTRKAGRRRIGPRIEFKGFKRNTLQTVCSGRPLCFFREQVREGASPLPPAARKNASFRTPRPFLFEFWGFAPSDTSPPFPRAETDRALLTGAPSLCIMNVTQYVMCIQRCVSHA